ncbi:hypothetical protein PoB_001435300, partial [Plakobranchus ocellatus]
MSTSQNQRGEKWERIYEKWISVPNLCPYQCHKGNDNNDPLRTKVVNGYESSKMFPPCAQPKIKAQ